MNYIYIIVGCCISAMIATIIEEWRFKKINNRIDNMSSKLEDISVRCFRNHIGDE